MRRQHKVNKVMPSWSRASPPAPSRTLARRLGSRLVKKAATAARALLPPPLLRHSTFFQRLAFHTSLPPSRSRLPLDDMSDDVLDASANTPLHSRATLDDISVILANIALADRRTLTHRARGKTYARTLGAGSSTLRRSSHAKQLHQPPPSTSVVKFLKSLPDSAKLQAASQRENVTNRGNLFTTTRFHPRGVVKSHPPFQQYVKVETSPATSLKPFPLLRLPSELRTRIYTFIISPTESPVPISHAQGPKEPTIALTSQQLRAEILHQFYRLTIFAYQETPGTFGDFHLSSLGKCLSRLGPRKCSQLRELILTFREPIRGQNWDTSPIHLRLAGREIVDAQRNASKVVVGLIQMGVRLDQVKIEGPLEEGDGLLDFRGVWKRAMDVAIREAGEMELMRDGCSTAYAGEGTS